MTDQTEAPADSWMGWSNGHWEGETLVIDTTGFNDQTLVRSRRQLPQRRAARRRAHHARPTPTTCTTKRRSRIRQTFTRPWKISMPLYRRVEKNAQLLEFNCVPFVEDLIYGHLRKPHRAISSGDCTCCIDLARRRRPSRGFAVALAVTSRRPRRRTQPRLTARRRQGPAHAGRASGLAGLLEQHHLHAARAPERDRQRVLHARRSRRADEARGQRRGRADRRPAPSRTCTTTSRSSASTGASRRSWR